MLFTYKISSTLLVVLFFSALQAQTLQPSDYNFYDSLDKTTLFYEGFDDLTISKWVDTCVCKDISAVNVSGYFYFINDQTQRNYYRSAATKAPIAENTDFEIEFRAKIPSENAEDYGVVFWGEGYSQLEMLSLLFPQWAKQCNITC